MKLSNQTLSDLPETVARPTYDRAALTPGIVHVGLGNFHRAHQAWYLHRLMQDGLAQNWAIIGAGVRAPDARMREILLKQDCLTTLIELAPADMRAEVVGSMIDYLPVVEGNAPLVATLSRPEIRIVALTITEGGYFTDPATGGLNETHPDIQNDLANPDMPTTVFGAIVAALKIRRERNSNPFTVQSCDNLAGNGDITRNTVVSLARLTDPALADWIDANCSFPNSMVDCIVPATGPKEIALALDLGIDDAAPVTHENYRQWVIEDDFCAGRPAWEKAGAVLTDDVHSYEAMKIRILNAGHQVIANVGELLSVETISGCMSHSAILPFFRKVQREEIAPYVAPVPGMTPGSYIELIEARFANPQIHDTTRRVAFDGTSRHPGFVLPILRDALAAGGSIDGLALVEALWARMCAGIREDGSEIAPNDPEWTALVRASLKARDTPQHWLEQEHIYGDLASNTAFAAAFGNWLTQLWQEGSEATIQRYARGDEASKSA